ncbi:alpha/beta fold hydrolase [Actinomyces haliotis]|uniref:alpha/beta fold hydrolase n=1 Tax=Actinomyces haliotis TaxID=1280843 RepID=UPI001E4BB6D8|nr:alpha/beta fold hydrolase [Actinomyces haliotis]
MIMRQVLPRAAAALPGQGTVRRPLSRARALDLRYVRTGPVTDEPVLVIPGGPGLASVLPYAGLRARAARLGTDVLMVEHRGVGLSRRDTTGHDLLPEDLTVDAVVDDLLAVLDAVGAPRALVYGSSYGAYLAAALGERAPERVAAMVLDSPLLTARALRAERRAVRAALWDGSVPGTSVLAARVRSLSGDGVPDDELVDALRAAHELGGADLARRVTAAWRRGRGRLARALLLAWAGHGPEPEGGSWPAFYEYDLVSALARRELDFSPAPDGAPLDVALAYGRVAGSEAPDAPFEGEEHDLPRALRRFTWPTVVVSGRRDMTTPPEVARRAAAGLPHGVLVTIDGGHSALENRPETALAVVRAIQAGAWERLPGLEDALDALPRLAVAARLPAIVRACLALPV